MCQFVDDWLTMLGFSIPRDRKWFASIPWTICGADLSNAANGFVAFSEVIMAARTYLTLAVRVAAHGSLTEPAKAWKGPQYEPAI